MKRIYDPKRSPSVFLNLLLFKVMRWKDVSYGWRGRALHMSRWEVVFPLSALRFKTIRRRWNRYWDDVVRFELQRESEFPPK